MNSKCDLKVSNWRWIPKIKIS